MSDQALTIRQASELTALSEVALRRRVERGTLRAVKRGGRRLIPVEELRRKGLIDSDAEVPAEEEIPPLTVEEALDRLERQAEEIGRLRSENERLTRELEAERTLRGTSR